MAAGLVFRQLFCRAAGCGEMFFICLSCLSRTDLLQCRMSAEDPVLEEIRLQPLPPGYLQYLQRKISSSNSPTIQP